jgi:hypothetical protein
MLPACPRGSRGKPLSVYPITVRVGPPTVAGIVLAGPAGEIVLDADQP